MVERARLLDRLSEGKDAPLIIISSAAGSGKTSLAGQWIGRDNLRAAWYSLDKTDNDGNLFFRYLLATLSLVDGRLASMIAADFRNGRTFAEKEIASQIIRHVSDLPGDIYLVLDDYHFVTSRLIHDALVGLLSRMPPNMHVVILTRYAIPFPLSPFRVRDRIVEISASEMKFSEEETARFFADIIPVKLTTDETHEVARHMEGWVGGLQLLGLSLRGKGVSDELGDMLSRGNRKAWDYLIDEVISTQPHKIKAFLEATAPLDRFDAEVAAAVSGMPDAGDVLDGIYRNNLFLIPLDGGHTWYRYHHLLSEAVGERMKASSPEKLRRLHQQAALWFGRNGYLEDAFRNAFASEDYEFAADLLEDYLLFVNDRYEYASGRRWLVKLPDAVLMRRALLRLHDCGQKVESFQLEDIEAVIRDIEGDREAAFARYEGHKRRLCEDLFTYFKHVLYYYYRDPAHADLEQLEKAARMISPENRLFSGYIKILVALHHISRGNPAQADAALKEASPLIISSGAIWARVLWFRLLATVQRMQGRLYRSEAVLREAFEFVREKDLSEAPLQYILYLPMAWIYYNRNEMEKASKYASGAASYGEHVGFARDIAEGNLLLSLIHLATGEMKEAEEYLRKVRLATEGRGISEASVSADPWRVRLSMAEGDLAYAVEWSNRERLSLTGPFSSRLVYEVMTHVELLLRSKLYGKVDKTLMKLSAFAPIAT